MSKKFDAIVLAAGKGERFGSNKPKQFLMLGKKSIISICINEISSHPKCENIILVINKNYIKQIKNCKLSLFEDFGMFHL